MERNPDIGLLHNEQRRHVTRSARPPCRVNGASKRGATWLSRGLSFAAREPHESVVAGLQVWLVAAIPTAPTRKARWWSSRFSIQPIAHSQRADKKAEILLFFLPLTSQKSVSSIPPPREHVGQLDSGARTSATSRPAAQTPVLAPQPLRTANSTPEPSHRPLRWLNSGPSPESGRTFSNRPSASPLGRQSHQQLPAAHRRSMSGEPNPDDGGTGSYPSTGGSPCHGGCALGSQLAGPSGWRGCSTG